jgi:hypothetical protein
LLWLKTGKPGWLVMSGILFLASSLIHSTTYLYLLASILLFIFGFGIVQFIKKDQVMLKKIFMFGGVFSISIITAWLTWMHKAVISLGKPMVASVTQGGPSFAVPGSFQNWVTQYLDIGTAILLIIAIIILLTVLIKGNKEAKIKLLSILDQPLSYFILAMIIVLTIGTFTKLGYNSERFGRDMASFIALSTAILLGLEITYYNYKLKFLSIILVIVIVVIFNNISPKWLSDYTAIRPCDRQVIGLLNEFTETEIKVQVSPTIAPWIYELYSNDNIVYTRVFDLEKYQEADYFLYRDNDMTYLTKTSRPMDSNDLSPELNPSIHKVVELKIDGDTLIVYKILKNNAD